MQECVTIRTSSPHATQSLAAALSHNLRAGDVINLTGELGAGKTCFAQGLAQGLGIKEKVTSPTFNLIKEYKNQMPLYHFDVYRLVSPEELYDLGYEEYFYGDGVTVIEWGDKIEELLPEVFLRIEFQRLLDLTLDDNVREIKISYVGKRWKDIAQEWIEEWKKQK